MDRPMKSERAIRRRQDPVSCRLCRLKKLKCNRQHPCSNCITRATECEFDTIQPLTSTRLQQDAGPSNTAILSRLQRLEDMIQRMNQNLPPTPESVSSRRNEPDHALSHGLTPAEESHLVESQHLSCIGTHQPSLYPAMSYHFVFDTLPLQQITKHETMILDQPYTVLSRQRLVILPAYADARLLFDQYAKFVCHFHNILHLPTFRKTMEAFYLNLAKKEPVNTDHGALILAVFITVMCYTKMTGEDDQAPAEVAANREGVFLLWFRAALDLLDHSRRVLPGSLEIVQTSIILVFLDYHLEGFTSRARAILTQGLQTAKELSLHRLDCPAAVRRRETASTIDSVIETEIKRRVWWHMVSTDWMVSLAGSASEGTYIAHPNQMRVCLPRNIEDEVLDRGNLIEDLPLTHPTPMSYPLQRVRLGEIGRSVIDTLRFGFSDPTEHDYGQVLQLDKRIDHFMEDLPIFLQLDEASIQKSQYIVERYPYLAMQRYIINVGAQSVRCKLHQPFLVQSNGQSQFIQSTQICISAAKKVININRAVTQDGSPYVPLKIRRAGLVHHLFLATVVLVMDLCFNGLGRGDDPRGVEVLSAIRMLELAKDQSASVQKFLDSLTETLQKHQIRLVDVPRQEQLDGQTSGLSTSTSAQSWSFAPISQTVDQTACRGLQAASQTLSLGSEDVWRGIIDQGDSSTMPDWDQLFSELDTFIA